MPGTYSQILLHAVFSTKERRPWIEPDVADRLYPYIGGVVRTEKGSLYSNHGFRLVRLSSDRAPPVATPFAPLPGRNADTCTYASGECTSAPLER